MTTNNKMQGGQRKGAGRPRKGEALRVPLTFSVDPATREKAQLLRNAGYNVNELVESIILNAYACCFNNTEAQPLAETMAYIRHWKSIFADTE